MKGFIKYFIIFFSVLIAYIFSHPNEHTDRNDRNLQSQDYHRGRNLQSLGSGSSEDVYFIVNGSKSLVVEPNMDLTFYCSISYPSAVSKGVVTSNGYGQMTDHYFDDESVQFTFQSVTCRDGGQYTCQTVTTEGQTQLRSTVNVSVKCAPMMRYPQSDNQMQHIQTSPNIYTDLTFQVFGHPVIDQFELKYLMADSWLTVASERYSATYMMGGPSSGWVALVIYDLNYENTTIYNFIMKNSLGSVEHKIRVVKAFPKNIDRPEDQWLAIGLGICCGIVFIIAMVTCVVFVQARRRGDLRSEIVFNNDNNFDLKRENVPKHQHQFLNTYKPKHTEILTAL